MCEGDDAAANSVGAVKEECGRSTAHDMLREGSCLGRWYLPGVPGGTRDQRARKNLDITTTKRLGN